MTKPRQHITQQWLSGHIATLQTIVFK